jgi:hypothetical protein
MQVPDCRLLGLRQHCWQLAAVVHRVLCETTKCYEGAGGGPAQSVQVLLGLVSPLSLTLLLTQLGPAYAQMCPALRCTHRPLPQADGSMDLNDPAWNCDLGMLKLAQPVGNITGWFGTQTSCDARSAQGALKDIQVGPLLLLVAREDAGGTIQLR